MRSRGILGSVSSVSGVLSALLAITGTAQHIDSPNAPSSVPVIVVLKEGIDMSRFASSAPDARFDTKPELRYLDRGVIGLVKSMETLGAFRADRVYSRAIQGFSAKLSQTQIRALKLNPYVELVEPDVEISLAGQAVPWGVEKVTGKTATMRMAQPLIMVTGVNAYVIDTGVDVANTDLNVVNHVNLWSDGINTDCNGHGTHVAGTIGAWDNTLGVVGVAPGVSLTGVKVLSCSGGGTASSIIAGIDWVTAHAKLPAVANISIGGPRTDSLDQAVRNSVAKGIFYAVAAGNYAADACSYSPSRSGGNIDNGIMTVASSGSTNLESGFSNYGNCVDTWAPGASILSTKLGGGTVTYSGTSMASPHVAGAAALLLSRYPTFKPAAVETKLRLDQIRTTAKSKDGRLVSIIFAGLY